MTSYPTIKLNNGYEMPLVGLGTFLSKNDQIMTDLLRSAFGIKNKNIIFF